MLLKTNEHQIAETQQNKPIKDFVNAVQYKYPHFSSSYQLDMEKEHILDMDMVMEHFRRHIKNQTTHAQKSNFHSTFQAITQQFQQAQKNSNQNALTFRNK